MKLARDLLHQIDDLTLSHNERAQRRCQLAKQLEKLGKYEGAREAMGELWQRFGERPALEGLDQQTAGEVLLRVGALTGCIGSVKQIEEAQELAKNLISESLTTFEALQDEVKVAEAQTEIACCYWREGAFDEARVMLQESLCYLRKTDSEVKAVALLRSGLVEMAAKRFNDALNIFTEAAPTFEICSDHALRAKFHNGFAGVLNYLSSTQYREDYVDRALIEYTAASFHFEQAGLTRYQACVENNLGFLFSTIGKFAESHEHLDRAQALLTTLKDSVHLAQVDDTRAKVLLAEGKIGEAEKLAGLAVRTLEKGGEQSLLAEALTTHGIALARLGRYPQARLTLQTAVEVAQTAGDLESAGQAALTLIEESGAHLSVQDLCTTYGRATDLLAKSQNQATLKRLCTCARRVLFLVHASPAPPDWTNFSFRDAVLRYESHLIERALRDAGGVVTRAAQWLGFKHHQSLVSILKNRHRDLLTARTPIVPRKRSIIRTHHSPSPPRSRAEQTADDRPILILHAEDNQRVAEMVKQCLGAEGWNVQTCADGAVAQRRIASSVHYDILLLDKELPIINGLELARYARRLDHRRQTPIVMFSSDDCAALAHRAGVDAFLLKPEDVSRLVETIARLLAVKSVER